MIGLDLTNITALDLSNVVKEGLEKAAKAGVFGYDELAVNHACLSTLTGRMRAVENQQASNRAVVSDGLVCEAGHPCWNPSTGKCDSPNCLDINSGEELMKFVLSKTENEQVKYFNAIFDKLKPK